MIVTAAVTVVGNEFRQTMARTAIRGLARWGIGAEDLDLELLARLLNEEGPAAMAQGTRDAEKAQATGSHYLARLTYSASAQLGGAKAVDRYLRAKGLRA